MKEQLQELDLNILADNGLRRGWTTGSCATAGVKAAVELLEDGEEDNTARISLPGNEHFLFVPVVHIEKLDDGAVRARVVKYAGDDPDNTDGATIVVTVKRNHIGQIRFIAGTGVGLVTEPGMRVSVGEPAINPAPRQMMINAIEEVLAGRPNVGYDLTIGCENGEAIAKRTFNPRLGIIGGISILGTTGIVEPMSLAAYKAAIEVYIRVALAGDANRIAYLPGNIGLAFARNKLSLLKKRIVQISNFVGFALDCAQSALEEDGAELDELWVLGHPGKLAKVLDGVWDTHSKSSAMAMGVVAKIATEIGLSTSLVERIKTANTVEAIIDLMQDCPEKRRLWMTVEERLAVVVKKRVPRVSLVFVRLFSMNGTALVEAA